MKDTHSIMSLSIFNSMVKMLIVSLSFFLGVHFDNIGLSGTQIGIIFAVGTLTSILTILPSGIGNDKIKSKHLAGIAIMLMGILYLGISMTHTFILILLLNACGAFGSTLYTASSDSLFYKTTKNIDVPKKIGIFQGLNYLMMGMGMIVAGFLLNNNMAFEKLFLIFSIGFFLMAVLSQFILPETPVSQFKFLHYKHDILKPKILFFLLIMFMFAIHFGAESTTYGLFLKKTLGLNRFHMGLYMGTAIITMSLSVWILVKTLHKIQTEYLLLGSLFLSGTGHILMAIANSPVISALFRIIHEIGDAGMFFFLYYGISSLFDLKRIGGNASIFSLISTLGGASGALVFGPLGAAKGYDIPLIVSGITTLLALILAMQFIHHFHHEYSTDRPQR